MTDYPIRKLPFQKPSEISSALFKSYLRNPLLSMVFQPANHRLCKGSVPTPLYHDIFKYSLLFYEKTKEKSRHHGKFPNPVENPRYSVIAEIFFFVLSLKQLKLIVQLMSILRYPQNFSYSFLKLNFQTHCILKKLQI